jgi:hypothetical protein
MRGTQHGITGKENLLQNLSPPGQGHRTKEQSPCKIKLLEMRNIAVAMAWNTVETNELGD